MAEALRHRMQDEDPLADQSMLPVHLLAELWYRAFGGCILPFPSRERIQTPTLSYGRPRTRCENCGAAAVRFLTAPARGLVRLRCGACLHEWDTADRRATPRPD